MTKTQMIHYFSVLILTFMIGSSNAINALRQPNLNKRGFGNIFKGRTFSGIKQANRKVVPMPPKSVLPKAEQVKGFKRIKNYMRRPTDRPITLQQEWVRPDKGGPGNRIINPDRRTYIDHKGTVWPTLTRGNGRRF